jgi:hypothetical protein
MCVSVSVWGGGGRVLMCVTACVHAIGLSWAPIRVFAFVFYLFACTNGGGCLRDRALCRHAYLHRTLHTRGNNNNNKLLHVSSPETRCENPTEYRNACLEGDCQKPNFCLDEPLQANPIPGPLVAGLEARLTLEFCPTTEHVGHYVGEVTIRSEANIVVITTSATVSLPSQNFEV